MILVKSKTILKIAYEYKFCQRKVHLIITKETFCYQELALLAGGFLYKTPFVADLNRLLRSSASDFYWLHLLIVDTKKYSSDLLLQEWTGFNKSFSSVFDLRLCALWICKHTNLVRFYGVWLYIALHVTDRFCDRLNEGKKKCRCL